MPTLNRRRDNNQPNRQGKNNRAFYQSHRWHEYSRQYRKKHPLCVQCLKEGKTKQSQCVDHIVRMEEGGDMWDATNHQALCLSCHGIKSKKEREGDKQGKQLAYINIIYGPPCSGKNTYIDTHKRITDIVIDVDDYHQDKHSYRTNEQARVAFKQRDRALQALLPKRVTIWIPTTTLKGMLSEVTHNIIIIDKTQDECLQYLYNSNRKDKDFNEEIINQWFGRR